MANVLDGIWKIQLKPEVTKTVLAKILQDMPIFARSIWSTPLTLDGM